MGKKRRKFAKPVLGGISNMSKHEIAFIVGNIGPSLQQLGRKMELSLTKLTELDQGKEGLEDKAHKMIRWWIQSKGKKATKRKMIRKLSAIGRNDIADELAESSHFMADKKMLTDFTKLQRRLIKRYSRYSIPQPPNIKKDLPIDDHFIHREMEKHNIDHHKETIELKDLFDPVNAEDPATRILVEGDPGFGKTTLALKLANDWAKGRRYIASNFHLVMLLPLQKMGKTHFEDFVVNIIRKAVAKKSYTKYDLNMILSQYKVLLILDGYEDLSVEARKNLNDVLGTEKLESTCILVTSKKGIFTTRKTLEFSAASITFNDSEIHWDTRVLLKGLTPQQKTQMLQKNFQINPVSVQKIDNMLNGNADKLLQCPLFVFWLGWMLEDIATDQIQPIDTRTSLFTRLFNLSLHKTLVRKSEVSESYELDVFKSADNDEVVYRLRTQIEKFGKLALDRLLASHELTFTEKELGDLSDSTLMNSDIFFKCKLIRNNEEETLLQPMDKRFLEFLAACRICSLANNESYHEFQEIITRLVSEGLGPSLDSFLFPFIAGLLDTNAHLLFNSLAPWSATCNVNQPAMINILLDVTQANDELIQSLLKFVKDEILPIENFRHNSSTEYHTKLFQRATARQLISVLDWDLTALCPLPHKVLHVKKLYLRTSNVKRYEISKTNVVHCDELICYVDENLTQILWKAYLLVVSTIVTEKVSLCLYELDAVNCARIFRAIQKDRWQSLSFHRVKIINCLLEKSDINTLIELVDSNRIKKSIVIKLSRNENLTAGVLDHLLEAAVTTSLDEFSLINNDA